MGDCNSILFYIIREILMIVRKYIFEKYCKVCNPNQYHLTLTSIEKQKQKKRQTKLIVEEQSKYRPYCVHCAGARNSK